MAKITIAEPLPEGTASATVLQLLQNHDDLMDLGSLTKERHPINPPPEAPPEEHHGAWQWYSITEQFRLPKDVGSGEFSSKVGFLDLPNGMISHVYSQLGIEVRDHWTIQSSQSKSSGGPTLWVKVESDIKCKFILRSFVKRKVKQSRLGFVNQVLQKTRNSVLAKIDGSSHSRVGETLAVSGAPFHLGVNLSSTSNVGDESPYTPDSETFELDSQPAGLPELDSVQSAKELDGREIGPKSIQNATSRPSSGVEKHTQAAQAEILKLDSMELRKRPT
ncbi:hypothetical protein JX265_008817 [Neoarthrinium moseri]|uniref:DUF7053 domain-containing protein n=1 Tax=Neoarthrinium moseri TaxID=1658444 RepID=A0A9Q0AM94_9PEZI|nr:hypothetical protein JX265_008817 [Neoarthrinium moseri]